MHKLVELSVVIETSECNEGVFHAIVKVQIFPRFTAWITTGQCLGPDMYEKTTEVF